MEPERRKSERITTDTPAVVRDLSGTLVANCVVCNLSDGGAKLVFESDVEVPREFSLFIGPVRTLGRRCQTIWRIGNKIGVRFPYAAGSVFQGSRVAAE